MKKISLFVFIGMASGMLNSCAPTIYSNCEGGPNEYCPALQQVTLDVTTLDKTKGGGIKIHLDRPVYFEEQLKLSLVQDLGGSDSVVLPLQDVFADDNQQDFLVFITPQQAGALNVGAAKLIAEIQEPKGQASQTFASIQIQ